MAEEMQTLQEQIRRLQKDSVSLANEVGELQKAKNTKDTLIKALREARFKDYKTVKAEKDSLKKVIEVYKDSLVNKKVDLIEVQKERDLLQIMIENPGNDSLMFIKGKDAATKDFKEEKDSLIIVIGKKDSIIREYKDSISEKNIEIKQWKEKHYPWPIFEDHPVCGAAVIIIAVVAITLIILRKGFSISKGNAKISVGDKDN